MQLKICRVFRVRAAFCFTCDTRDVKLPVTVLKCCSVELMLKKIWTPKINFFFCLLYLEVVSFSVTTICRKLMRIFSDSCFESLPVSTLACVGPSVAIHYAQWLSFFPPRILPAIWCLFFPPFIEWWREIKSLRLCLNKTFQKTVACHGSVRVHTPTYCCSFLHFPSQKGEKK